MSVEEFSAALKDSAYKAWFKNSTKSILIQTAAELRKTEQTKEKTSFILRPEDIENIANTLAGRQVTSDEIEKIAQDLRSALGTRKGRSLPIVRRDDNTFYYPNVSFDTIDTILRKGFSSLEKQQVTDENGSIRDARISDYFHRGHVFGIATNILDQTLSNFTASKVSDDIKAKIIPILEATRDELKKQDLETSNIKDIEYGLYAKYSKNKYRYLVEIQSGAENTLSGQSVAPFTNMLRRYLDPAKYTEINKFFRKRATEDNFIQKLITSKGSPSYLDIIEDSILEAFESPKTKHISGQTFASPVIKLDTIKISVDTKELNNQIKKDIQDIDKTISNLKDLKPRAANGQFISLVNIQNLINKDLADQIISNMGRGRATKVLNNRTGRLAHSAEVTQVTMRDGQLTAFYTYMKYPYATFEPGGQQGIPESRDPRLLIEKSVRQIATEVVKTRLRVIPV